MVTETDKKDRLKEKQAVDARVAVILDRTHRLMSLSPLSPNFLGKSVKYPALKRKRFLKARKIPDISQLREEVVNPSENGNIFATRKNLNGLIKRFPYEPDLRVLKGIQMMYDTSQSGLDSQRLDVLKGALQEAAIAVCNDGLSVFNAAWLVKIYLRFVEMLQRKVVVEHRSIVTNYHWQVQAAANDLHRLNLRLNSLMSLKDHMNSLSNLQVRLKGTPDLYYRVRKTEIIEATQLMMKGEAAITESGKTGNYILWVIVAAGLVFSRMPILDGLVKELIELIPDISHDVILQKRMIETNAFITDYQTCLASGDTQAVEKAAFHLYRQCMTIIKNHLIGVNLFTKTYEIDPFLKAAWIVKEMNGMLEPSAYRSMLEEASNHMTIVMHSSDNVKDSSELASKLKEEIEEIILGYGSEKTSALKN